MSVLKECQTSSRKVFVMTFILFLYQLDIEHQKTEVPKQKYKKLLYWPSTSVRPLFLHYQFRKLPSFCGATPLSTSLLQQLLVALQSLHKYTLKVKVMLHWILFRMDWLIY